jgi:hypothetical protein
MGLRQVLALLGTAAAVVATMGTSPVRTPMAPPWTELGVIVDDDQPRVLDSSADRIVWRVGVTAESAVTPVLVSRATVLLDGSAFTTSTGGELVLTLHQLLPGTVDEALEWELLGEQVVSLADAETAVTLDSAALGAVPTCDVANTSVCSLELRIGLEAAAAAPITIAPLLSLQIDGVSTAPTVTFEVEELKLSELSASP